MQEGGGSYLFDMRARGDWVRLRTLVVLRWIAVIGQSAAVLFVSLVMGYQLPLSLCAMLISASVAVNLVAVFLYPTEKRLSERSTLASLMFDLFQIVALLLATGGLNNPFALLILAPVTISASALRLQSTLWLGITAMVLISLMSSVYMPLIDENGVALEVPEVFRSGITAAMAVGITFLSLYARRVSVESYAMSQALTATQVALSQEQRLAAIGGLAAAAAHELGTPLATIKLTAKELVRDLADREDLAEDARLIHREAERCGRIMADLSRSGREDSHLKTAPVTTVLEEAAAPHMHRGKEIVMRIEGIPAADFGEATPIILRRPELVHGLRNLVQNAVDFADRRVWIDVRRRGGRLHVTIGDDGPGFSADVLRRLGEPFVSTRSRGERRVDGGEYEGMGLGVFIARTLLARTGGRMSFTNGGDGGRRARDGVPEPTGAVIDVSWPEEEIVIASAPGRRGAAE